MGSFNTNYKNLFVGLDIEVPLINGEKSRYIFLDNAASTPSFTSVQTSVNSLLPFYSSVHRGTGYKSQLSTAVYEQARESVLHFLGADPGYHTCIFVKNTTEAINKLARRFPFSPEKNLVLTSGMEHHSNDLPWRDAARTVHIKLKPDGILDEDDFDAKLAEYRTRIALVAVTGASNVTGFINPIHRLAEKVHAAGALIFVDCAQLAPHRKIEIGLPDESTRLDFIALSSHKMYAPFGSGALVGPRSIFMEGEPDMRGGGTVEIVTLDSVVWAEPPDKDEAGSPNTVGAVAMAAAVKQLEAIGMDRVAEHETEITAYALSKLKDVGGLIIYGDRNPEQAHSRLGVIPIAYGNLSHFLAAAVLGFEFGIGVRSGCFCAHPYILHLLGLSEQESNAVRDAMLAGDRSKMPGMLRISFGLYNTKEEVDILVDALKRIGKGDYRGTYLQEKSTGEYLPKNWQPNFEDHFTISTL
jgi:cysteine desulfurase / selenocysteine lyase